MKRIMKLGLALTLCGALLCGSLGALAEVKKGDKGDAVKAVQQLLKDLGYLAGAVDSDFGGGTEKAVKAFQAAEGLEATGVLDDDALALLRERAQAPDPDGATADEAASLKPTLEAYAARLGATETLWNIQSWETPEGVSAIAYTHVHPDGVTGTTLMFGPPTAWQRFSDNGADSYCDANLEGLSWTKETRFYSEDRPHASVGEIIAEGRTAESDILIFGAMPALAPRIDLPNDTAIAGEQTVVLSSPFRDEAVSVRFRFDDLGDGQGWAVELLGSEGGAPEKLLAAIGAVETEAVSQAKLEAFPEIPEKIARLVGGDPIPLTLGELLAREDLEKLSKLLDAWEPRAMLDALLAGESYAVEGALAYMTGGGLTYRTADEDNIPSIVITAESLGTQTVFALESPLPEADTGVAYTLGLVQRNKGYGLEAEFWQDAGYAPTEINATYEHTYYNMLPPDYANVKYIVRCGGESASVSVYAHRTTQQGSDYDWWYGYYGQSGELRYIDFTRYVGEGEISDAFQWKPEVEVLDEFPEIPAELLALAGDDPFPAELTSLADREVGKTLAAIVEWDHLAMLEGLMSEGSYAFDGGGIGWNGGNLLCGMGDGDEEIALSAEADGERTVLRLESPLPKAVAAGAVFMLDITSDAGYLASAVYGRDDAGNPTVMSVSASLRVTWSEGLPEGYRSAACIQSRRGDRYSTPGLFAYRTEDISRDYDIWTGEYDDSGALTGYIFRRIDKYGETAAEVRRPVGD